MNHMIVRYRRQTHTRVWELSRKDSLFIPQTFTERMALPSASEQMAQGNRYTRPPPNWRIPYSPPMTNQSLLRAPICCDLEPKYSLCLFSTEKQIATNFSLCRRELRNSVPSWHKQFQLPSEFGLKPDCIFLVCDTVHEKYNLSHFFFLLLKIFKN